MQSSVRKFIRLIREFVDSLGIAQGTEIIRRRKTDWEAWVQVNSIFRVQILILRASTLMKHCVRVRRPRLNHASEWHSPTDTLGLIKVRYSNMIYTWVRARCTDRVFPN